ncbi:hypothetical protein MTR67_039341 [Solanum verrucosum]|uniref:Integrase zinc-binding domain-containing protein n=1 Tax=Solanum verrucosum TaxID=315347 RepID=A0AAF0UI80_SOLVR|nr:hypothetical protein MTR67_039341 [Solanum verrucosum]
MNPPEFLGSQVGEDPQNIINEVKKIFGVIQLTGNNKNGSKFSLVAEVKGRECDPILLQLKGAVHQQRVEVFSQWADDFWWNGMKRDIADFVAKCPNCQQVKVEHQKPGDRVTKSDHFLAVKTTNLAEDYAKIYINEIVRLHKGVMIFGKKGKLSPRYVGPYKILKRVGKVAYELELPADNALQYNSGRYC